MNFLGREEIVASLDWLTVPTSPGLMLMGMIGDTL
jgi:hypothetical protein